MAAPDPGGADRAVDVTRPTVARPLAAAAADLVELGIEHVLTVPGSPATALVHELGRAGAVIEDALNEKTAAELAFGRSLAGQATAVVVKGNGALLAAEPLQNAGPHGIGAPLLLIVGDDVTSSSSTVPTDARPLGPLLVLPVFDLGPGELQRATIAAAIDASLSTRRPVILRFTAAMSVDRDTHVAPVPSTAPADLEERTVAPPDDPFRLTKFSRFVEFAVTRAGDLEVAADTSPSVQRDGTSRLGILAAGATWECFVAELSATLDVPALGITAVHPLPQRVLDFCRDVDRVLVLEEGRPFVEDAVQELVGRAGLRTRVLGQHSKHLPPFGATTTDDVLAALEGRAALPLGPSVRPADADVDAHEYRLVFEALEKVQADTGVEIHTCVGSCISASYAPYSIATSALNLGGATGVAAGFSSVSGRPSIALVGDYGLVHSGLTGLQLIAAGDLPVLTIVLANGRSTKTGGQPSAVAARAGSRPLDLERLVTPVADGARVEALDLDRCDVATMAATILELLRDLPATLLVRSGGLEDPADR